MNQLNKEISLGNILLIDIFAINSQSEKNIKKYKSNVLFNKLEIF